jgi:hypothetical protein
MPVDDMAVLSEDLQRRARSNINGEVSWSAEDMPQVLGELSIAGRVVLGLDVRDYDDHGSFTEVAWRAYEGSDAAEARDRALTALESKPLPGRWVLVTW